MSIATVQTQTSHVISRKRELLEDTIQTRFKGMNLVKETVYVTSDVGTASFSIVQGISLLTKASPKMILFGSISGMIGGVLNMGQGLFLLSEALLALKNGQYKQGARVAADALILFAIGALMTIVSLASMGLTVAALGALLSLAAHPFMMPIFILLLVLPGLIQTADHIILVCKGKDIGSHILDDEKVKPYLARLHKDPTQMMEEFSQEMGVEAAIEAMDLLNKMSNGEDVTAQKLLCQKKIAAWNRTVKLRALQLSLYALTFPLGVAAASLRSGASKIVSAVSKFFLTAPSSIGGYLDATEPFKRNGAIGVPKVDLSLKPAPQEVASEESVDTIR